MVQKYYLRVKSCTSSQSFSTLTFKRLVKRALANVFGVSLVFFDIVVVGFATRPENLGQHNSKKFDCLQNLSISAFSKALVILKQNNYNFFDNS